MWKIGFVIGLVLFFLSSAAILTPEVGKAGTDDKNTDSSIIFDYIEQKSTPTKTRHGRVDGGNIYIYPENPAVQLDNHNIAATCVAAAKFYIDEYSKEYEDIDRMLVVITDMPYDLERYSKEIYYSKIGKLASCQLMLLNRGWDIINIEVADRNTTPTEKNIEALWFKLNQKFIRENRINDEKLKEEIARQLNLAPEDVNFTPVAPKKIYSKNFENIQARRPVGHAEK